MWLHLDIVIIVSLAYLLEDGPELILQYYWVDRYAGMKYEYPDGTSFSGRLTIVLSSLASLTVAVIGIINLISLYKEFTFWLKFRALQNYLTDHKHDWAHWTQRDWSVKIPSILHVLNEEAEKEFLVERIELDFRRITRNTYMKAWEQYKAESKTSSPKVAKKPKKTFDDFESYSKHFAARSTIAVNFRKESDEKAFYSEVSKELEKVQRATKSGQKHNIVLLVLTIFGLIPLIVNLLRLAAAIHQVMSF